MWTKDQIVQETRWSRTYMDESKSYQYFESKFLESGVSVTLAELVSEWPMWSDWERLDFCIAIDCDPPKDSADVFRFLARDKSEFVRSTIALRIATLLPPDESVPLLADWAKTAPSGKSANYLQALTHTADPRAHQILQDHFACLLDHPQLIDDADSDNEVALDLVCCVKYLLELDTPAADLRVAYEKLSQHPSNRIREFVARVLAESFGEISSRE